MDYVNIEEQEWSFDNECVFMQEQRMFTLYDDDGECRWIPLEHYTDAEKDRIEKELFEEIGGYAYPIDWDFPIAEAVDIYNRGLPPEYHLKMEDQ